MPNIVDLSVNCPSNCSLIGTSSVMRNFLLGKNLPQVPTDIIEAGLVNQWYNDGNLAPEYNNLDPQALIDIGNVLSDINAMRTQHANLNLYDDYSDEHYNPVQFPNYTQYPLISIDDSHAAVTLAGFGDIESWTDPEEALVNADTWVTKWTLELSLNRYSPNDTYNNIPTLASHSDNIVSDISLVTTNVITQFTTTDYNVSSFITTNDPNTIYTPLSYYQQLLQPFNRYQQTANQSYLPSYFGLAYFNYADPNLTPQPLDVNPNHENIDSITDPDGVNITAFPTSNPQGARDWYNTTFNDYSITNVYGGTNISAFYTNGNENFIPANNSANGFLPTEDLKDNIIQNIDGFILEIVPGAGSYGLITNEPYDPNTLRELNCLSIVDPNTGLVLQRGNVYGVGSNSSEITSEVDVVTNQGIYDFNTVQKDAFICYSYVDSVTDPFTYGIQGSRGVIDNILRPETKGQENYLPAQATINVANGVPMDTRFFGTTSKISNALGFVLPANPIPLDAVLNQIDKNIKDTPLGKTAKAKLASEFFNRIAENLRNEAYGMAEKIGAGLTSLAGNLLGSMVGRDTSFKSGFQQIADAFKRHDITVPKSLLGKAASLVANLAGSNAMLDPIQEPISWTSNVPKTDPVSDTYAEMNRTNRGILNKLFGFGTISKVNDPSEILLAYTSAGQKDFLKESINLNKYTPYYQISGFLNLDAKKQSKLDRKAANIESEIEHQRKKLGQYQKQYDGIQKEIDELAAINFNDNDKPKYNLIKRSMRVENNEEPVISFNHARSALINNKLCEQIKITSLLKAAQKQQDINKNILKKLIIENPLPFYPIFDDGSFYFTSDNSMIEPREFFISEPKNVDQSGVNRIGTQSKDFAKVILGGESNGKKNSTYHFPIDNKLNTCRYYRNHNDGIAPVDSSPDEEGYIEKDLRKSTECGIDQIYYKVSDLVKHGAQSTNAIPESLRGLNIKSIDGNNVGYNVYPILPKNSNNNILHQPGLGREDLYEGQSLFSVLESNGFVKISPLWAGDGYGQDQVENVQAKKKRIEESNGNSIEDYKDRVKIHRYMFSIENLAWKGFSYQLPWWERGPNGGRVMWFPPYDLRISDTTSVALGMENLIGRNEPVYTYNHSERSGVLNFKMIMDFPGYHADTKYEPKPSQEIIPQQQQQDITEGANIMSLLAPQSDKVDWDLDNETNIYIMLDGSGSITLDTQRNQTIEKLFVGNNALFRKKLVDEDKIYTADEYKSHVFVFEDPGFLLGTDNIDDGRFLSWFAAPYFMSIGQDSHVLNIVYNNYTYTTAAMSERLLANIKSDNGAQLAAVSSVNKVVVIAVLNECGPAYTRYTTDPNGFLDSVGTTHRFYSDAVDYVKARQNYTDKFKGIILGYDWVGNQTYATLNDMFGVLVTRLFGNGNLNATNINNINVQTPPQIHLEHQDYKMVYNETTTTGNYTTSAQTTPVVGEWGDIKYQLEIGAPGNVIGGDEGGDDSETNIIYVLKKALSKDSVKDVKPVAVKKERFHPLIGKLRAYMKRMANDASNHKGVPEVFVWNDSNRTKLTVNNVNQIVGPSESANENVYDIPLYELLTTNRNTESRAIQQLDVNVDVNGDIKTVFDWIQSIASNNNGAGFTNKGDFTSDGWKAILKHMIGEDNASNESKNDSNLVNDNPQADLDQKRIPWGIDITDMSQENQLNEFLYFKRIEQFDPLYRDKIKDKILYFDPSFHSITPVGFSNRLNFLEQCARQGPSINNRKASDGRILNANSNLAFGRPPISVLRIGDFYHTRIAIEGVDLSYEPLIFDMNPEGIGVQPMIVDVTINFKYLGGSSLSGPITQLQNAVSNNYFANVEFYHNQALKAFERNVPNADLQAKSDTEIYIDNQNFGQLYDDPIQNPQEQQNKQNKDGNNNQNTQNKNNSKASSRKDDGKRSATKQCPVCPDGFTLYSGTLANPFNEVPIADEGPLCVENAFVSFPRPLVTINYVLTGAKPCRTPTMHEMNKAIRLGKLINKKVILDNARYTIMSYTTKCKTAGCK